jgi:integrase
MQGKNGSPWHRPPLPEGRPLVRPVVRPWEARQAFPWPGQAARRKRWPDEAPGPGADARGHGRNRVRSRTRDGALDRRRGRQEADIRCHFVPHFAEAPIAEIGEDDIAGFIDACLNDLSVKTVRNLYVHLNAIFEFAIRRRWCHANPCKLVDKPASVADDDTEIRFLDQAELDALLAVPAPRRHSTRTLERAASARVLRDQEQWKEIAEALGCSPATAMYLYRATAEAATDEDLSRVDLAIYLTAAMTGLRQGELLALRWRDVDWPARKIRVSGGMRNGQRRTPKSPTSSRAVPMADRVGGALDRLFQTSAYQGDDDLVFGHPHAGRPWIAARSRSGSSGRFSAPVCERSASTISDIRSERGWPPPASRSEPSRHGWATPTSRRRWSTPTTRPNEVDLVNDAFDPRVMVEGANEGAKPSETQPHSDP